MHDSGGERRAEVGIGSVEAGELSRGNATGSNEGTSESTNGEGYERGWKRQGRSAPREIANERMSPISFRRQKRDSCRGEFSEVRMRRLRVSVTGVMFTTELDVFPETKSKSCLTVKCRTR
jgi:hypothetical protein